MTLPQDTFEFYAETLKGRRLSAPEGWHDTPHCHRVRAVTPPARLPSFGRKSSSHVTLYRAESRLTPAQGNGCFGLALKAFGRAPLVPPCAGCGPCRCEAQRPPAAFRWVPPAEPRRPPAPCFAVTDGPLTRGATSHLHAANPAPGAAVRASFSESFWLESFRHLTPLGFTDNANTLPRSDAFGGTERRSAGFAVDGNRLPSARSPPGRRPPAVTRHGTGGSVGRARIGPAARGDPYRWWWHRRWAARSPSSAPPARGRRARRAAPRRPSCPRRSAPSRAHAPPPAGLRGGPRAGFEGAAGARRDEDEAAPGASRSRAADVRTCCEEQATALRLMCGRVPRGSTALAARNAADVSTCDPTQRAPAAA